MSTQRLRRAPSGHEPGSLKLGMVVVEVDQVLKRLRIAGSSVRSEVPGDVVLELAEERGEFRPVGGLDRGPRPIRVACGWRESGKVEALSSLHLRRVRGQIPIGSKMIVDEQPGRSALQADVWRLYGPRRKLAEGNAGSRASFSTRTVVGEPINIEARRSFRSWRLVSALVLAAGLARTRKQRAWKAWRRLRRRRRCETGRGHHRQQRWRASGERSQGCGHHGREGR